MLTTIIIIILILVIIGALLGGNSFGESLRGGCGCLIALIIGVILNKKTNKL